MLASKNDFFMVFGLKYSVCQIYFRKPVLTNVFNETEVLTCGFRNSFSEANCIQWQGLAFDDDFSGFLVPGVAHPQETQTFGDARDID